MGIEDYSELKTKFKSIFTDIDCSDTQCKFKDMLCWDVQNNYINTVDDLKFLFTDQDNVNQFEIIKFKTLLA